jgi:hypothetical protein
MRAAAEPRKIFQRRRQRHRDADARQIRQLRIDRDKIFDQYFSVRQNELAMLMAARRLRVRADPDVA